MTRRPRLRAPCARCPVGQSWPWGTGTVDDSVGEGCSAWHAHARAKGRQEGGAAGRRSDRATAYLLICLEVLEKIGEGEVGGGEEGDKVGPQRAHGVGDEADLRFDLRQPVF